jgi:hypothetical protein
MTTHRAGPQTTPSDPLKAGQAQIEGMLEMQKEVLAAYEQISRGWLDRMKSEGELWCELAKDVSAAKSMPEVMAVFQDCTTKRMQMIAEDARRMMNDGQTMAGAFTRTTAVRWPTGST